MLDGKFGHDIAESAYFVHRHYGPQRDTDIYENNIDDVGQAGRPETANQSDPNENYRCHQHSRLETEDVGEQR